MHIHLPIQTSKLGVGSDVYVLRFKCFQPKGSSTFKEKNISIAKEVKKMEKMHDLTVLLDVLDNDPEYSFYISKMSPNVTLI